MIEWRKPAVKATTFEEIAKYIRAKARSGGTSCNICSVTSCSGATPCTVEGSCSCNSCDPLAFGFSCQDLFVILG